jgi:hypothetical protein
MVAYAGHNITAALVQAPADGTRDVPAIVALGYLTAILSIVSLTGARKLSRSNRAALSSVL